MPSFNKIKSKTKGQTNLMDFKSKPKLIKTRKIEKIDKPKSNIVNKQSNKLNTENHLDYINKTNLGSFYTPKKIVDLTYSMLNKFLEKNKEYTILEPSCGYGAYLNYEFNENFKLVGADIDDEALKIAKNNFSHINFFNENTLNNINREKYEISTDENLIIVGNPPYNDTTSQVKNKTKKEVCIVSRSIKTRDLGLSSILAYERLNPDFVAILHPLSFLIKKANFKLLKNFMNKYKLIDQLVFSSSEFNGTSDKTSFPILIAIYKKDRKGTIYKNIFNAEFKTIENNHFSLNNYEYIDDFIRKYPQKNKSGNGIYFYTLRDVNALKRSRTFISENIANAIEVDMRKINYYHYVDIFKDYAKKNIPYYLGNFNIFIDNNKFLKIQKDFEILSKCKHKKIFNPEFNNEQIDNAKEIVENYFKELFNYDRIKWN